MCQLYPRYESCCGVPVRIALIFIAILSIVTGAIINAALKKAGVNVSSIEDLKNISISLEANDTELSYIRSEDVDTYEDVELTTRKLRTRSKSTTTTTRPEFSTVEILGEDGQPEIIRFSEEENDAGALRDDSETSADPPTTTPPSTTPPTPPSTTPPTPPTPPWTPSNPPGDTAAHTPSGAQPGGGPAQTTTPASGTTSPPAFTTTTRSTTPKVTGFSNNPSSPPTGDGRDPDPNPPSGNDTHPPPHTGETPHPPPHTGETPHPPPHTGETPHPPPHSGETPHPPPHSGETSHTPPHSGEDDHSTHDPTADDDTTPPESLTTDTTTEPGMSTTPTWDEKVKSQDSVYRTMGSVNRNGLNLLAVMFVGLGILLLVGNFLNSPDLVLLYVVLLVATDIAAVVLLVSVVTECTKEPELCVLHKMDWFSGFMVTVFWFFYIFIWAFFAAVANTFANGGIGNTLLS